MQEAKKKSVAPQDNDAFFAAHSARKLRLCLRISAFNERATAIIKPQGWELSSIPFKVPPLDDFFDAELDDFDSALLEDESVNDNVPIDATSLPPLNNMSFFSNNPCHLLLRLPSQLIFTKEQQTLHSQYNWLVKTEIALRTSQLSDSLQKIRLALASKAKLWRNEARHMKAQSMRGRLHTLMSRENFKIAKALSVYRNARFALQDLGADLNSADLKNFREITRSDLVIPKDLDEEARTGQKSHTLPWIWRLTGKVSDGKIEGDAFTRECESPLPLHFLGYAHLTMNIISLSNHLDALKSPS
jgi:hypothetical protein